MANDNAKHIDKSNQRKLHRYSSNLVKKGLDLAGSLKSNANTPEAWRLKGNDIFRSGDLNEALICYEKALELDDNYSLAWNNRGSVLGGLQRYQEAVHSFEMATITDPQNDLAWQNMAKVLGSKFKNYKQAIQCFDKVIEINSRNEEAWFLRGADLEKLERYEEAIENYKQAININPNYLGAWVVLGNLLNKMEEYEDALFCYNSILKIDKLHIEQNKVFSENYKEEVIWMLKGEVLESLERTEDALASYQKALQFVPNEHESLLWYQAGSQLFKLERYQEAIYHFDKALSVDSSDSKAWYAKAQIFFKFEMYEEAIDCYERCLLHNPKNISAWNNKGYTLEKLGRYLEALDSYQKVFEIDPDLLRDQPGYELALDNATRLLNFLNSLVELSTINLAKKSWETAGTLEYFRNKYLTLNLPEAYGVADLEISHNGQFMAAIDTRGVIGIWDLTENHQVTEINFFVGEKLIDIVKYPNYHFIQDNFYYSFKKKFNYIQEELLERIIDSGKLSDDIIDLIGYQCYRIKISSDSKYLFAINGFYIITLELQSGKQVSLIERKYNDIAIDPVRKVAVIPSIRGIEVWNLTTGVLDESFYINSAYLCYTNAMKISENGNYIACNLNTFKGDYFSQSLKAISGEFELGLLLATDKKAKANVMKLSAGNDIQEILKIIENKENICIWNLNSKEIILTKPNNINFSMGRRTSIGINEEYGILLNCFSGNNYLTVIEAIDISSRRRIYTIEISAPSVNFNIKTFDEFIFVFDNNKITSTDGLYIYDIKNGSLLKKVDSKTDIFSNYVIDTENNVIIFGCANSSIQIWNYLTGDILELPFAHEKFVSGISRIASNQIFASTGDDKLIKIWRCK
ncbi:tetratricopeptide repeat protein [Synechocystis sp. PCC 7339]|uniref:tetratricopeptide repeat protein n=1 Tax=Synechocystis sp. PCC 7339 TaxID=2782213 RepID=UPI001CBDB94E|nr:tetratricopeptide repeat protein [Synechocystis sp. PCC 7339]UAJ73696.1 tetratricopeptide repeat protein [Synechocystis sp. PCC 7339]